MQSMAFIDKNTQIFLRRKHKLIKSLSTPPPKPNPSDSQINIINLYQKILNKENQITHLNYFIKHQFECHIHKYIGGLMNLLWQLLNVRSGSLIAFVFYRLCRKYPSIFWHIQQFLKKQLKQNLEDQKRYTLQEIIFLTDLFLYGFPLTLQQFMDHIFPHYQTHILDILPKYISLFQSNEYFLVKNQKIFRASFERYVQQQRNKIMERFRNLSKLCGIIQQNVMRQTSNDIQQSNYQAQLQKYETNLYKVNNAMISLEKEFNVEQLKLKTIFELKKQCKTFKESFEYSKYQKSIYQSASKDLQHIRPIKRSQMVKIEDQTSFVTQVKFCGNVEQCLNLSGYFLEQMNIQYNRQNLIEIIINDCCNYNNIAYILKILFEIGQLQPSVKEYCINKAKKICGQMRMNQKYQRLLCEMARFSLIDENILLDYCQKILHTQNNQITKEVESILQNLGAIVYYRSLSTHIRINAIFEKIQTIIKNKLLHFSIQNLFHLKSIINYLRTHTNHTSETQELISIEDKANFTYIFKKMDKLIKENDIQKVIQYFVSSIDQQDFLKIYYYASLVHQLGCRDLKAIIHEKTLHIISQSLENLNSQRSVKWSRFLGELYNYQVITRKKFIENLKTKMQKFSGKTTLGCCLKSICAGLQTSKGYIIEGEKQKEKNQAICLVIELKKTLIINREQLESSICCEIEDLSHDFHPHLSKLNTVQEINSLLDLPSRQVRHYSTYHYLDLLMNGYTFTNLPERDDKNMENKKKYKEKEQSVLKSGEKNGKYVEKKMVEGLPNAETEVKPEYRQRSPQPTKEVVVQKKIKLMARRKQDKSIKIVTHFYSETIKEP